MTNAYQPTDDDMTMEATLADSAVLITGTASILAINATQYQDALTALDRREKTPPGGFGADLVPGDVVKGRYTVRGILGTGGMGTVYHAHDSQRGIDVALKLAGEWASSDDPSRLQLSQEFRAMANFRHPNLPLVHDFGETDDGVPFLSMEYVAGRTCQDLAPIRLKRFYPLFVQLLRALAFIHERGYLHRDIKPQNAIVSTPAPDDPEIEERLVLLDFGLMERIGSATDTRIRGTPRYMAPEVVAGHPLDPRTDLYALGLMGYHLLAGESPFVAPTARQLFELHAHATRPSLADSDPSLPTGLCDLLQRMIAADPRQRPDSADAVLHELAALTDQVLEADLADRRAYLYASDLVGRDDETAAIDHALSQTADGPGKVSLIAGHAGMGKSRLLEYAQIQAMTSGFAVAGSTVRRQDRSPYQTLRTLLHGLAPLAREYAIRSAPHAGWARVSPPADILDAAAAPATTDPAPGDERDQLHASLHDWLGRLAACHPIALMIDDLQWCDDASMYAIAAMAARLPDHALLIAAYRPDELQPGWDIPTWEHRTGATTLALEPLTGDDFSRFLDELLGNHALAPALIAEMETLTGGTPFYIIELLRSFIDRQLLQRRAGRWELVIARYQLPSSLQELLSQRLDSLSADARQVAEILAIAGGRLDITGVAELFIPAFPDPSGQGQIADPNAADDDADAERPTSQMWASAVFRAPDADAAFFAAIDELHRLQLVRRIGPSLSLVHDHVLTTLERGLAPTQARHLHQRLADWLAKRLPEKHPDRLALLGQHYAAGDEPLRGLDLLERAGRRAYAMEQHGAARDLLLAAVDLLETHPDARDCRQRQYDLKKMLGVVCMASDHLRSAEFGAYVYEHAMSRGILKRLPALRRVLPDPLPYMTVLGVYVPVAFARRGKRALVELRRDLTDAFLATSYEVSSLAALGRLTSAREHANRLRGLSLSDRGIANAFIISSTAVPRQVQDGPGAYKPFERLRLVLSSPLARFVTRYTRHMMIGMTHYMLAYDSAVQLHPDFERDLAVSDLFAKKTDHVFLQHVNAHAAVIHACQQGDLNAARRLEEEFQRILQRLGGQARLREWQIDFAMARLEIHAGELSEANRRMQRLLAAGDSVFTRGYGMLLQAMLFLAWKRPEDAIEPARTALHISRQAEVKAVQLEFLARGVLGHTYLELRRFDEVEAAIEGMNRYVRLPGHRTRYFAVEVSLLRLRLLITERPRIAVNVAKQTLQVARELNSPRQTADSLVLLAQARRAYGEPDKARADQLAEAARIYERLGNTYRARLVHS